MDITNYLQAGYGALFIETTEIRRAIKSIKANETFNKVFWNPVRGIVKEEDNLKSDVEMDHMQIIDEAQHMKQTIVILENYDNFLNNFMVNQTILNAYPFLKANQTCLVIVGNDHKKIPTFLKEFIPVIEFNLPTKDEITKIANEIAETTITSAKEMVKNKKWDKADLEALDFESRRTEIIDACLGMSYEEIENILAFSAITKRSFDLDTVLARKRQIIKSTGFMDFMQPSPIEDLGGLDLLKDYFFKRQEPFNNPDSVKPKVRSILLVGVPGCGKSLAIKIACSIFGWPGIILDAGGLKGGIVGETEQNTRTATKIIDAFGHCIVGIDELEKIFAGTGAGHAHETSEGMLGHFLTWMQERQSEGIVMATANKIDMLPPEMLRAGRWDAIFFVNLPNPNEIKNIVEIKNRQWKSELPINDDFCNQLYEEKWSGAEIEQLAKDSHFEDSVEMAMKQIPILAKYRETEMAELKKKAAQFKNANSLMPLKSRLGDIKKRKLSVGESK